jgi:glycosyltransferase involved in cell wall biosynthesis
MQILYDGQIYAAQTAGGINRYFGNIIDRLPPDAYPTLTTTHRTNKLHYPTHPNLRLQEFRNFRPARISNRLRTRYFRWLGDRTAYDIQHPTYYDLLTNEPCSNRNGALVITVHDMIHELFADRLDPEGHTIRAKRDAIQAAQKLICVSENTKRDLLEIYPEVAEKVVVIYEASELILQQSYGNEPVPSSSYFLYVGGRTKEYKNFDTLLFAFSKAISIHPGIQLCVVGSAFNESEQQQITALNLTDRIQHYQYATDTHLAKLYRCAQAFIYPSLYEGFGIPPLEAMACGTVVIAADSSSIPEVVGDAGILFPPKAAGDLADIMLDLLDSPSERDRLITKGFDQCRQFSWDETAEQTVAVYRSLL